MTHSPNATCSGCGILHSDGYTGLDMGANAGLFCKQCAERRMRRLRRGILFTATGYAGELIDNTSGRIVAGEVEAA